MSQPLNFEAGQKDPLDIKLSHIDQLEQVFQSYERKADALLMGIEYEIFGHDKALVKPLSYEGKVSITTLFFYLVKHNKDPKDPWVALMEQSNIVALTNDKATIALEPGGQIEIAAKPHNNLLRMNAVFNEVLSELQHAAENLNIDLFALGIHPLAKRSDMAQVKKSRYDVMRAYMQKRDGLKGQGLDMMTRTCSIQLNIDFMSEADMVKKTRLGAYLVPIFSLLCSSSAFLEGKPTSHALERGSIWQLTDPDRTGIPKLIFDADFGYRAWINYVLDVPMYFIRRGTTYIDVAGASFRDFMRTGLKNEQASVRDFMDHLTTVFSEIRLKPFLELRSCDSLPAIYVTALSTFTWALFFNKQSLEEALDVFKSVSYEELVQFHNDTINYGRAATLKGRSIFALSQNLLNIASRALNSQEKDYLKPFESLVQKDTTCAEWQKEHYEFINKNNIADLISYFRPLT